jgi:hypothetical protein
VKDGLAAGPPTESSVDDGAKTGRLEVKLMDALGVRFDMFAPAEGEPSSAHRGYDGGLAHSTG